jgi:glyoxylase-like metal-dependent hydrolase (beta-lactamase superfamily II)
MADFTKRLATNVEGNFFVDATCIDCDACRQLAPASFVEKEEYSCVYHQPATQQQALQAYQALLACPVGSIGTVKTDKAQLRAAAATFPIPIEDDVYYNGFHSEKSFGASSYFVRAAGGNWLIDSPRFVKHLVDAFERLGGVKYILLSHEDDVADAHRYAQRFGAARIIHRADLQAQSDAECVIEGYDVVEVGADFRIIPVPGHTEGSMALLYRNRFLFTGDHLSWDRETAGLCLATVYVWSEDHLRQSTKQLLAYDFDWILPGHGDRIQLPPPKMKEELRRLLERCALLIGLTDQQQSYFSRENTHS